jgi:hypothetical protein
MRSNIFSYTQRDIRLKPVSRTHSEGSTPDSMRFILTYSPIVSHRMIRERFTLYRTPPTKMLFFNSLNLILTLPYSFRSSRDRSLEHSLDGAPLEEVEESSTVMDALRTVPYGLRILLRISLNSWGTSVDCQVSSCRVLMISR